MLENLLCALFFSLPIVWWFLYMGPLQEAEYRGKRNLAWKIIWGLRNWVGNLATFCAFIFASLWVGSVYRGVIYAVLCGWCIGMFVSSLVVFILREVKIPTELSPDLGPYRSLLKALPHAFPKTLPRKFYVFLLNFYRSGWDDSASSTEKT
ncbi:MAG: hypothetical protein WC641_03210 [Patescibacteria group bacterium]